MLEKVVPAATGPVLVTGGAGFIGSHVVDALIARGERVIVLDDFNDFYDPARKHANLAQHEGDERLVVIEGDIRDAACVESVFQGFEPRRVIHLAARAGVRPSLDAPLLYETTNITGTMHLLDASRRHGVQKFVFGSSSSVYGINNKVPFAEVDPIARPISPYAATKAAGELFCHTYAHLYGLPTVCLRFFTVYGPRQRPDLAIAKFARMIQAGEPIPVFGDGSTERDYTYVADIVAGVLAALAYETSFEIFNLGNSATVTLGGLITEIEATLGIPAIREPHPLQPGDVPRTWADIAKSQRLLGFAPATPLQAGLAKYVAWLRDPVAVLV